MRARFFTTACLLFSLLLFSAMGVALTPALLPAKEAFRLTEVYSQDDQTIVTRWDLAPNYYLYRDHFLFQVITPSSIHIGQPQFPTTTLSKKYPDGKQMPVFTGKFSVMLPVFYNTPPTEPLRLKIQYQGCSEYGVCYPKQTKIIRLAVNTTTPTLNTENPSYLVTALHSQRWLI